MPISSLGHRPLSALPGFHLQNSRSPLIMSILDLVPRTPKPQKTLSVDQH